MKTCYTWDEMRKVLDLLFPEDPEEGEAWLAAHYEQQDGYWHLRLNPLPPRDEPTRLLEEVQPCPEHQAQTPSSGESTTS